jgi:hypothetical protein
MINLNHTLAEVELMLKHLGNAAYAEVAPLIAKIHSQALPQAQAIQAASVEQQAEVGADPTPVVLGTPEPTDAPVNPEQNVA